MKKNLLHQIFKEKDELKAQNNMRFFKTGKGQYAEGDIFLGLNYPQIRALAKKYYKELSLVDVEDLLNSEYHEVRACALLVMVSKYKTGADTDKTDIYKLYIKNADKVNNWDLVDNSAPYILGDYAFNFDRKEDLFNLAKSGNLWKERISIVSSLYFIKHDELDLTFELSKYFISHKHDLIQKASGWMLREAGKKDQNKLELFLKENISCLPRTTLRYAIERFPEQKRKMYLNMK